MNRNKALLDAGIAFCKAGGSIDFTTSTTEYDLAHSEYAAASALAYCLEHGVDATKLTMSSDGHASLPIFDDSFNLLGLEVGKEASLHTSFMQAVHEYGVSIEHALMAITSNPAQVLGLNKGTIRIQGDADLVLLDEKTLSTKHVWSNGKLMVEQGEAIVKGPFE